LIARQPVLSDAIHYVLEAPANRGAYYGARQFASHMWQAVASLAAHYPGPFVLVGFSRGGLVALEVALRICQEQAKAACALALSPPLDVPDRLPVHVRAMGGFASVIEGIERAAAASPTWAAWLAAQSVELTQRILTAMVLKNLGVTATHELDVAIADMRLRGALAAAGRATREFRMLQEVRPRESTLFLEDLTRTAAESPHFHAEILWGAEDGWVDAERSTACLERALAARPAARARIRHDIVPRQGHAQFRATGADMEHAAESLARVLRCALESADAKDSDARALAAGRSP
jgi:pimeloyl-ACP methyl ester carboxylesterase